MNPFLRPDSASELDMLTDAALAVLFEAGLVGLSISAIARRIGVTPPALTLRWREEDRGARARILQLVVLTFGERWHLWSRGPLMSDEPSLSMPATSEEIGGVRAWLAFQELARTEQILGNPDVHAAVQRIRERDRDEVRGMVRLSDGRPLDVEAAAAICALAEGLRTELACDHPAIDVPTAERALQRYVAAARA